MKPGLTLAEREELRTRYRDAAIARAALTGLTGMTIRCREMQHDMGSPDHRYCLGEKPGNGGCLCRCHDAAAATQVLNG